jgi:phosphatidylglycerol:prolipoprotein diacylglycerol transferase
MLWMYPLIMAAAIATGVIVSRRTQQSLNLDKNQRLGIALGAFCGGMIGAKLPFVLYDWQGLLAGTACFENGKTITMGLVGGYFGVELAKYLMQITTKTGDGFAAPVAASIGVGRLACFVGGCCYGIETDLPWGIAFRDGVKRHPTQLYETLFHLTCAVILVQLQKRKLFRFQLIKLYIITYLAYRFLTEYIRPEPIVFAGMTAYQWAAVGFIPVFAALWWWDAKQTRR